MPEALFSLLWPDSSISTPTLEMWQRSIYSAREVCPEAWPPQPAPADCSAAPTHFPSWFMESSALKWLAAPHPQPWLSRLSRGLQRPEGQGKGLGRGVMPWSLHSCWTSSLGLPEERWLSRRLSFEEGVHGDWLKWNRWVGKMIQNFKGPCICMLLVL